MTIELELLSADPPSPPCKGLIYRVRETRFIRGNGAIVYERSYIPLKRQSCPGCDRCSYLVDDLPDFEYKVIDDSNALSGDLVELISTNVSHDWETGYVDSWDLAFVKVHNKT